MPRASYTLTEIARRLDVPQHRLIHLCEKGVVVPQVHDAAGRGSSRVFSELNFLELALAVQLREMTLPVTATRGIVHVVSKFAGTLQALKGGSSLVSQLRRADAPDLRVILSDGRLVYFSVGPSSGPVMLFGGIELAALVANDAAGLVPTGGWKAQDPGRLFGGPEGSRFSRMELSITAIAQALPVD